MHRTMGMSVEEYLDFCRENSGMFPRYKGYQPFKELLEKGRIAPFVTIIRVMYSGPIDQCYCLNDESKFLSINDPDKEPQNPKEVLSEKKNPDGWEVEMAKPKHFFE